MSVINLIFKFPQKVTKTEIVKGKSITVFIIHMQVTSNDQEVSDSGLLEWIYCSTYENYESIIDDEEIAKVLDVNTNSLCLNFKKMDPNLSVRDLQCRSFTVLCFLLLTVFCVP
jgi:hypothetical protein